MASECDSDDSSSSYEESDSSDLASDKVWTCDDIYPSKGNKTSDSDDSSVEVDDSSSSRVSLGNVRKATGDTEVQSCSSSSESDNQSSDDDDDDDDSEEGEAPVQPPQRPPLQRHSSGEIEVHITAQSKALANAKVAEEKRRSIIESNKDKYAKSESKSRELSESIHNDFETLSKEYDSSEESMKSLKARVEKDHADKAKRASENNVRSEEKAKFEKRNMEREMRLAKARERIEKKKDDEAAKEAQERLRDKDKDNGSSKLDMSKAARVERAYSWYSRMAMPTREKMKERVEYMPASSGVTPDDVDLLPWNARGTFVSVAAMMRMNRTASSFTSTKTTSSKIAGSDTDSD
jgi:hypothetical protein